MSSPNGASSSSPAAPSASDPGRQAAVPETIAALATPVGHGAIAIVRLSGPRASEIARVVFSKRTLRPRVAERGTIRAADGDVLDDGLAVFFPAPHSATGEDVVELHVHGSPAIARETLVALLAAGARLAQPGEFTRRAYLAGKLDLSAAEAVGELIAAEHRGAARAALGRLAGGLATEVDRFAAELLSLASELAASLDYPDEVAAPDARTLVARVRDVDASLAGLAERYERGRLVRDGIAIAIVGPPNAGKSTLLNALLGADRALVSPEAGTTRDTIEERIALGDGLVGRIVDTAGLRETRDPLERAGIARSEASLAAATLALVVLDAASASEPDADAVLALTRDRPRVVFYNKADLGGRAFDARPQTVEAALLGSAHVRGDVEAIRAALVALAIARGPDAAQPSLGTARQVDLVFAARRALAEAAAIFASGDPVELALGDLLEAHAALGALTGRDASEVVLDAIFSRFCVGK